MAILPTRRISQRGGALRKAGLAAFASVALAATAAPAETANPFAATGSALPTVTVVQASRGKVVGRIPISGTLVPMQEVLVFPEITGVPIERLLVDVGDTIEAGELIVELSDRTHAAQLKQAEAELARAEAAVRQAGSQIAAAEAAATQANSALERMQRLLQSGTTTQSQLDQAIANAQTADANLASARDGLLASQAQLLQAQASLDIARDNFERTSIHAPATGIVSARNGKVGAIASAAGDPIFTIIVDGAVEIEAEVIETSLGDIAPGARVDLTIAGVGETTGTVRRVSPTVNARNRLGMVRITIDDDAQLRAGLFASGWIVTAERIAITVPATAVLTDPGGTYVLVSSDGTLERRPVVAGLIWNGLREIVGGLTTEDVVVAKAGAFFSDGDKINPARAEGAAQ